MRWYQVMMLLCIGWLVAFLTGYHFGTWWESILTLPVGIVFVVSAAYVTWKDDNA
jgi:hypothetical protein